MVIPKDKVQTYATIKYIGGMPGWLSSYKCLALVQVVILESWVRVPHWAPFMEPASPSAYVSASLSASLMNKQKILKKKKNTNIGL